MDSAFKLGLLLAAFLVALSFFQQSQNSRYQYVNDVVLDTRTGEFWLSDGSHFEPRAARITYHSPDSDDERKEDERRHAFHDCLWNHPNKAKECLEAMLAARGAERLANASASPIVPPNSSSEQANPKATRSAGAEEYPSLKRSQVEIQAPARH